MLESNRYSEQKPTIKINRRRLTQPNNMTTFSIIYLLSFLFTIPLWVVAHNGLLGEAVCEKMLEEARNQGVEGKLLDKDNNKTLVFMLGVIAVTPVVNTVLAVLVIKYLLFK